MRHFKKELISNRIWLRCTGAAVVWEPIGDDQGVFATDSQPIIAELDQAASKGTGGIVIIDEAQYQDAKKKGLGNPSLLNSLKDRFSLSGLNLPVPSNLAGLAAATNPPPIHNAGLRDIPAHLPDPIQVTTEFTRPKTGKFFKARDASK